MSSSDEEVPRLSLWYLVALSVIPGVSDFGYAVEGAYGIPVILAAGIPLKYASLTLSLSPLCGMIIQPFIGSATDQCKFSFGRRRPFILVLGIIAVLSAGTIPYYFYIASPPCCHKYIVPSCVVVCMMLFDLCIGSIMIPGKALMLDIVPPSQENKANLMASAVVSSMACLGFGLGAVDWSWVLHRNNPSIHTQSQIVFGITAGMFVCFILVPVFFIREKSSQAVVVNINNSKVNYGTTISRSDGRSTAQHDDLSDSPPKSVTFNQETHYSCCGNPFAVLRYSILDNFKYLYLMSRHMWILFWAFTMAFAADFSFTYSFTIFFGTVVYGGDSSAPVESESYRRYTSGVRMGSLGLAIGSAINIFLSLIIEKLMKYLSIKTLLLVAVALFNCCTCLLMWFHEFPVALTLAASYGFYLGMCVAIPFGFVSNYKRHSLLFRKEWTGGTDVVEGKTSMLMLITILLGQIISTLIITPIVDFMNDGNYFMFVPCVQSAITFFLSCCLTLPKPDQV